MLSHDDRYFSVYPTNRVVGFIDRKERADEAIKALKQAGIAEYEIDESFGEDGLHFLDPDGKYHGTWTKIVRTWQALAQGEEKRLFDLVRDELGAGHVLVSAPASNENERVRIASILKKHSAHDVRYYGRFVVEDLN